MNPENPEKSRKSCLHLLLHPRQIKTVSLPLDLLNLRRLIPDETRVAKKPVFKKADEKSVRFMDAPRLEMASE